MPDQIPVVEPKPVVDRAAAIAAWHDADTDAKKTAVVAQFPVLVEIYAAAANFKPKS
jgi:hypothetical protein